MESNLNMIIDFKKKYIYEQNNNQKVKEPLSTHVCLYSILYRNMYMVTVCQWVKVNEDQGSL